MVKEGNLMPLDVSDLLASYVLKLDSGARITLEKKKGSTRKI